MAATKKVLKPWVKALIILITAALLGGAGYTVYSYIQSIPDIEQGTITDVEINDSTDKGEEGQYTSKNEKMKVV